MFCAPTYTQNELLAAIVCAFIVWFGRATFGIAAVVIVVRAIATINGKS